MKMLTALLALSLSAALNDCQGDMLGTKISPDPESVFYLCQTKSAADGLLRKAADSNYFLMINSIDSFIKENNCTGYHLNSDVVVEVISSEEIASGPYSQLVFAKIAFDDIGVRYTSYFTNRRTGQVVGAVKTIIEQRTEAGINSFADKLIRELFQ